MDRTQHYQQVMSADTLTRDKVRNAAGEDLGKIEDFMFDMDTGHVEYAVLSFSGVMGVGDKLFAVPPQALRIDKANECLVLNVDKERLKNAPGFDKHNWPATADRTFAEEVYRYYGQVPYWGSGSSRLVSPTPYAERSSTMGIGGSSHLEDAYEHGERGHYDRRPSVTSLLRQLVNDVTLLFTKELALAASEINGSIDDAKKSVGGIVVGAAVLYAGLLFLLLAATAALALVVPTWAAALIVGGAVTLIGFIMLQSGKRKLQPSSFAPDRAVASFRRDHDAIRRHAAAR